MSVSSKSELGWFGHRIRTLEAHAVVDRELIEELHAEGLIQRERAENLEAALRSARIIGAAIGILMARRTVNEVVGSRS